MVSKSFSENVTPPVATKAEMLTDTTCSPSTEISADSPIGNDKPGDFRGRPSHDMCHKGFSPSILSHRNTSMNLRGLLNLVFLVVVAQNARLVIENFMKYGELCQLV